MHFIVPYICNQKGAQCLSGRVLDSRPKGRGFEPHRRHCVVSLSKNINPSLVLVQPRKTRPFITERLLMGRKESNPTKTKYLQSKWMLCFSHATMVLSTVQIQLVQPSILKSHKRSKMIETNFYRLYSIMTGSKIIAGSPSKV